MVGQEQELGGIFHVGAPVRSLTVVGNHEIIEASLLLQEVLNGSVCRFLLERQVNALMAWPFLGG